MQQLRQMRTARAAQTATEPSAQPASKHSPCAATRAAIHTAALEAAPAAPLRAGYRKSPRGIPANTSYHNGSAEYIAKK
jgi:hypothetical protein